jgi:phthiocerol/phenolphthiocerol synthesis type-I polyketide synthase D
MYFASFDGSDPDRYRLLFDSARYGDRLGYQRLWLPERHFMQFGASHPNPSVLAAALSRETKRIRLAAGSIVAPLHHAIRIAEEWSVVDNLSGGRVDLSFASGWHPNDFALAPELYGRRHDVTFATIQTVKRLWRGEMIPARSGDGKEISIRSYPSPVQKELPIWVTAARNPETFRLAGEIGANVLTYLVDLGYEGLRKCIGEYHRGRHKMGHEPGGHITVMLHTYVGDDAQQTRRQSQLHYCRYLRSNADLLKAAATHFERKSFEISDEDADAIVVHQFERVYEKLSLMGTVSNCVRIVNELRDMGVNEIACLIDFVSDSEDVLSMLPHLTSVRDETCRDPSPSRQKIHGATPAVPPTEDAPPLAVRNVLASLNRELSGEDFYNRLREMGGDYGPFFQVIRSVKFNLYEAIAVVEFPVGDTNRFAYGIPPYVLDSCLSTVIATSMSSSSKLPSDGFGLPLGFEKLRLSKVTGFRLWTHAVRRDLPGDEHFVADVRIYDDSTGELVGEAIGLRFYRFQLPSTSIPIRALGELRAEIVAFEPPQQRRWVENRLIEMIAEALETSSSDISPDQDISRIGLDSLMAMEIRSELQHHFGVTIPISYLLESKSIRTLAEELLTLFLISQTDANELSEGSADGEGVEI